MSDEIDDEVKKEGNESMSKKEAAFKVEAKEKMSEQ